MKITGENVMLLVEKEAFIDGQHCTTKCQHGGWHRCALFGRKLRRAARRRDDGLKVFWRCKPCLVAEAWAYADNEVNTWAREGD